MSHGCSPFSILVLFFAFGLTSACSQDSGGNAGSASAYTPLSVPAGDLSGTPADFSGTRTGTCSFNSNSAQSFQDGVLTSTITQSATTLSVSYSCCPSASQVVGCEFAGFQNATISGNTLSATNITQGQIGSAGLQAEGTSTGTNATYVFSLVVSGTATMQVLVNFQGQALEVINGTYQP